MRRVLLLMIFLVAVSLAGFAGWVGGGFVTARGEADRRYAEDLNLAAPVLAANPAFQRLMPVDFPVNGFCLSGPVATQTDYDRLRAEMIRLFGEPRAGHVLADVWIEAAAKPNAAPVTAREE